MKGLLNYAPLFAAIQRVLFCPSGVSDGPGGIVVVVSFDKKEVALVSHLLMTYLTRTVRPPFSDARQVGNQ